MDDFFIIKKYNNKFSFVNFFSINEKEIFNEAFMEIGKFLKFSDGVIITNEYLSNKLKNYTSNVFINRNAANEEIWKLSQSALVKKNKKKLNANFIIGYFNDYDKFCSDFENIKNALIKILKEFNNVFLLLVGKLTLPNFLYEFSSQIIYKKYFSLKKLSEIISNFDINIAPL